MKASKLTENLCPGCGLSSINVFYELKSVPVHSVFLIQTQESALNFPKGDITLGCCNNCGFIFNLDFHANLQNYSSNYEATQGYSTTFNAFHYRLAENLISRFQLQDKTIIEIGCGKGEFLRLLCELGGNRGIGFDPAYTDEYQQDKTNGHITFIKDFYSENYSSYSGDLICCKMTLEHIPNAADFISMVRRSIGDHSDTVVFFQIPDVTRILKEVAFWDIYYEHCSYFGLGSLGRLFQTCGFEVVDIWKDYGDQYLMIEAKPVNGGVSKFPNFDNHIEEVKRLASNFSDSFRKKLDFWHYQIKQIKQKNQRVVLWSSSSKSVAFLTTLKIYEEIQYVVDINPNRQGTYMAGTGQKIISPEFLTDIAPDIVIVMNPVYSKEIQRTLEAMGLSPELMILE